MARAVRRYDELAAGYLPRGPAEPATVHVYLGLADFQLRFVTMCAAAGLRERDQYQVGLSRSPGFGTYIAFLKNAGSSLRGVAASGTPPYRRLSTLVDATLSAIQDGSGKSAQFGTIERLRNHVFHGGLLPDGDDGERLTSLVRAATEAISIAVREFLGDAVDETSPGDGGLDDVRLRWPDASLSLWPFICADGGGGWCLFASFVGATPAYVRRDQRQVRIDGRGERLILTLNESMVPKSEDRTFPDFVGELRADLAGFRDPDHEPHHHEVDGVVNLMWVRATSTGTEERSDSFRIGHAEQREWEAEPGHWMPYPTFLRKMANWPVVATRIRQQLQAVEERLIADEQTALGWTSDPGLLIEPLVRLTDLQNDPEPGGAIAFGRLRQEIDQRLAIRGSRTRIYFVAGEAGIGKTRTLLRVALDRAVAVEQESGDEASNARLPLFLYVRSTGQVLNSLQTVVNAAAADTRNLNDEGIRALCRQGLIALFIDGFDELLGGVGYDDALGSLRTWIEDMGGRGVIVVSARSSYYLNQYRSSLQRRRENQDLAVEHRVAMIERWSTDQVGSFLDRHGVSRAGLEKLSHDDRELLGLPFFARVYVESMRADAPRDKSLPDLIVDQYLVRESGKLIMPGDQQKPMLSVEELHRVFAGLAELMAGEHEREVTLEYLQFAAQVALGEEFDNRRGLANRLSVLCGVAVSGGPGTDQRFAFQHELFYDHFLAEAVLQNLRREMFEPVYGALGQAQWRIATVSRVTRLAPKQTRALLSSVGRRGEPLSTDRRAAFYANVAMLSESLSRRLGRMPVSELVEAVFETLDLTGIEAENVRFDGCTFRNLVLPPIGAWRLQFHGCTIGTLWVKEAGTQLRGIEAFEDTAITELTTPSEVVVKQSDIAATLRRLGAALPPAVVDEVGRNEFAEAVDFYLGKIQDRADSIVVWERGHQIANDYSNWANAYGGRHWTDFIKLLEEAGAAELVSQTASGPTKLRVKFLSAIPPLRARDLTDETAARFWKLVEDRR